MQDHGAALVALENWLRARIDGNVADWTLDDTKSATLAVRGQAGFTFRWDQSRARADQALSTEPIDAQVNAALAARPIDAGLAQIAAAEPRAWLRPLTGKSLPGYQFRETKRETCDSCRGRKVLDCGTCGASGRVSCGTCRGTGSEEVRCRSCGGVGYFVRTRQVQVHDGQTYRWINEDYRDTCWGCGGRGRQSETCSTCRGSGTVSCGTCSGSGKVTCGDCRGQGTRLYLYTRTALVSARSGLALDDVPDENWRTLLSTRWEQLIDRGEMVLSNVRRKEGSAEGVLKLYFDATGAGAAAMARAGNASAYLCSIGTRNPVVDGEPFLARVFDLPGEGEEADWVALAERLTGKRMLREAIDVTEAMPKTGGGKEQREAAESAAITQAALASYGPAIGEAGASALASVVVRGVGALRDRMARATWRGNLGIAALIGLAGALIGIGMVARQYEVTDPWIGYLVYAVLGTVAAGFIWGILGHMRVRTRLKALARDLDLETPLAPPRHGWTKAGWLFATLITAATVLGSTYGAWRLAVPQYFRFAIDRQLTYANGETGRFTAWAELQVHLWPDAASPVIATTRVGDRVRLYRPDEEWVLVSVDRRRGYVHRSQFGDPQRLDGSGKP